MALKPCILDEYSSDKSLRPQNLKKYTSESDKLILEDESGRIVLKTNQTFVQNIVTGVIMAVYGVEIEEEFEVEDFCFIGLETQPPLPLSTNTKYVAFISGLNIGDASINQLPLQMFIDFVTGYLGSPQEQEVASQIVRVVVAGNSTCEQTANFTESKNNFELLDSSYKKRIMAAAPSPMNGCDMLFSQIAASIPIDVMSGNQDVCNLHIPQQPIHSVLLPISSKLNNFITVTNPYQFKVDNTIFLGTSGQPVEDITKYSELSSSLEILEKTLEWGCLAPTAPDTLDCYPFYDQDPFIINGCPHVYFVGNQPYFKFKIIGEKAKRVLLVCVPTFWNTGTAVLVNINTLECKPLCFLTFNNRCNDSNNNVINNENITNTEGDNIEPMEM